MQIWKYNLDKLKNLDVEQMGEIFNKSVTEGKKKKERK